MPFADLVLEGGGVKGIALVGAIEVLEEHDYQFKRVAGTSAGSIVGALLAARAPAQDMVALMRETDYHQFEDCSAFSRSLLGKGLSLLFRHGLYRGEYLRSWLAERLETYGVRTFADLRYDDKERLPPPDRAYRLVVTVSDISEGRLRYLPWHYDRYGRERDSQSVADAVRASMSIPFLYRPVCWEIPEGRKSKTWLVDGGMLSNFPITAFDAPPGVKPRWPTLGIKLSATPDAAQRPDGPPITGTISMTRAMVKTMTGFYDRMHVETADAQARTIFVDTGKIRTTDFDLGPREQEFLYQNGRKAAWNFLHGTDSRPPWDFEAYIRKYRCVDG